MASERQRLIELALESLWNRKKEIDKEIENLTRELGGRRGRGVAITHGTKVAVTPKKRARFTKEERLRRSRRMKAYWDRWRKEKKAPK